MRILTQNALVQLKALKYKANKSKMQRIENEQQR